MENDLYSLYNWDSKQYIGIDGDEWDVWRYHRDFMVIWWGSSGM